MTTQADDLEFTIDQALYAVTMEAYVHGVSTAPSATWSNRTPYDYAEALPVPVPVPGGGGRGAGPVFPPTAEQSFPVPTATSQGRPRGGTAGHNAHSVHHR